MTSNGTACDIGRKKKEGGIQVMVEFTNLVFILWDRAFGLVES